MKTIGELYSIFVEEIRDEYSLDEARSVATIVFEHLFGFSRIDITLKSNDTIDETGQARIRSIIDQLKQGRPVQYIIGETWFRGMKFFVNEHVLIPRRETEELVELIVSGTKNPSLIIDFCTGSGCIAIALKKAFPESRVIGVDISEDALKVALRNAIENNVLIEWVKHDVLQLTLDLSPDLIVSNPPYVMESEKESMAVIVKDFEPDIALFVTDFDPLIFYRSISKWAMNHAVKGSSIYYEVNEQSKKEISDLHSQYGFRNFSVLRDMQDKDRFFKTIIP